MHIGLALIFPYSLGFGSLIRVSRFFNKGNNPNNNNKLQIPESPPHELHWAFQNFGPPTMCSLRQKINPIWFIQPLVGCYHD